MADELPDFRSTPGFAETLQHYLARLEEADQRCAAAAEGRREVLKEARENGLVPGLLKQLCRERAWDQDFKDDLQAYRDAVSRPFSETDLGQAAQ
jgi:hypothetical protein